MHGLENIGAHRSRTDSPQDSPPPSPRINTPNSRTTRTPRATHARPDAATGSRVDPTNGSPRGGAPPTNRSIPDAVSERSVNTTQAHRQPPGRRDSGRIARGPRRIAGWWCARTRVPRGVVAPCPQPPRRQARIGRGRESPAARGTPVPAQSVAVARRVRAAGRAPGGRLRLPDRTRRTAHRLWPVSAGSHRPVAVPEHRLVALTVLPGGSADTTRRHGSPTRTCTPRAPPLRPGATASTRGVSPPYARWGR